MFFSHVFGQILILICCTMILLSPLLFWMYLFVSFQHLGISRKQFLFGLGAGALSTIPLLYSDMFVVGKLVEEIFFSLFFIVDSFLGISLSVSMGIFFILIFLLSFILSRVFLHNSQMQKYLVSFGGVAVIVGVCSVFIYLMSLFSGNSVSEVKVESGSFVFMGVIGITSYYMVVSLLEEGMKYISSLNIASPEKTVSFASMLSSGAVIALGFAFFENILYSYQYIATNGVETGLLQLVFFRSFFTIALHVLCGMLLSGGFYMLLILRGKYRFATLLFFVFSLLSIASHAFFDIALTFGYIGVIFLYVFLLYLLMGYITASEG